MAVKIPEVSFVEKRKQRMDMQEILLYKFIENRSCRYPKTTLGIEEIHVLGHHVM